MVDVHHAVSFWKGFPLQMRDGNFEFCRYELLYTKQEVWGRSRSCLRYILHAMLGFYSGSFHLGWGASGTKAFPGRGAEAACVASLRCVLQSWLDFFCLLFSVFQHTPFWSERGCPSRPEASSSRTHAGF